VPKENAAPKKEAHLSMEEMLKTLLELRKKFFRQKLAEMTTGAASKNTGHAEAKNTEEPKGKVVSSEKWLEAHVTHLMISNLLLITYYYQNKMFDW